MVMQKAGAVIRIMDNFTGAPAPDKWVLVKTLNGKFPVKKGNGYYVFWDSGCKQSQIMIESTYYQPIICQADTNQLLYLWLDPGRAYPYPSDIRWHEQVGEALKTVDVLLEESGGLICLDQDYKVKEGLYISLKVTAGVEIIGRRLAIIQGDNLESFTINRHGGGRSYQLNNPLKYEYNRRRAKVFIIYQAKTDENGIYRYPYFE